MSLRCHSRQLHLTPGMCGPMDVASALMAKTSGVSALDLPSLPVYRAEDAQCWCAPDRGSRSYSCWDQYSIRLGAVFVQPRARRGTT